MVKNKSMKKKKNNEWVLIKVKALISEQMKMCNTEYKPYLCRLKETEEGYKEIENFCVQQFFETDMDISDALTLKEQLLNPNYIIE
jgi:hypothetical protein